MTRIAPKNVSFRHRIGGLEEALRRVAEAEHRSVSSVMRSILVDGLRERLRHLPANADLIVD
jgi:hypothetical protein